MMLFVSKFKGMVSETVVFNSVAMCRTPVSKYMEIIQKVLKAI